MKKIPILFSMLLCSTLLSGCNTAEQTPDNSQKGVQCFEYSDVLPDNGIYNTPFTVDESNNLYVLYEYSNGENKILINVYDSSGNKSKDISISTSEHSISSPSPVCFEAKGERLYFIFQTPSGYGVYFCDTNGNNLTEMGIADDFSDIFKAVICSDEVYLIGTPKDDCEHISKKITLESGNTAFFESDLRIIEYMDKSGQLHKVEAEYPITLTSKSDGTILIYAFDETGGYYFYELNSNDKIYNNSFGLISDIDSFGKDNEIALTGYDSGKLCITKADSTGGISDICENVYTSLPDDIKCTEDNIFFRTRESSLTAESKLLRVSSDQAASKGRINIIASQYIPTMPFSGGYEIQSDQLSSDMFSTKVVSLSSSFDISYFDSSAEYAKNMKSINAFYPLNDIDGVSEYIDKCFPYLKEACTNDKGEIWALPISLDIPVIVYNRSSCEKAGFNFSNDMTLDEFILNVYKANKMEARYDCIRYHFVRNMFAQYLVDHSDFDTDEFKTLAATLKEKCTEDYFKYDTFIYSDLMTYNVEKQLGIDDSYTNECYQQILFTMLTSSQKQTEYLSEDTELCAIPLPKISGASTNNAVCTFMCINPAAENLENAKEYISMMAKQISQKPNNLMMYDASNYSDNDYCTGLREIYSNGSIYFEIPTEIYYDGFDEYCADGIDLDTYVHDCNEKMKLYLWEKE